VSGASKLRRTVLMDILVRHQRLKDGDCSCGWDVWGKSWAAHVADAYEEALKKAEGTGDDLCWARANDPDRPFTHVCDLLAAHAGPHSCRYCGISWEDR
jgi:hypothetical protein